MVADMLKAFYRRVQYKFCPRRTAKNLGVLLDDQPLWTDHFTSICKAANFQLFRFSRTRMFVMFQVLHIAVHALIPPCIDYCNSILVGLLQSHISGLQHMMKCAACLVISAGKFDHITLAATGVPPLAPDFFWESI